LAEEADFGGVVLGDVALFGGEVIVEEFEEGGFADAVFADDADFVAFFDF